MIEVLFKSGRTREYRNDYQVSGTLFGENALTEIDYRFDDLEDGLFVELSCQRPQLNEDTDSRDIRGAACYMEHVAYMQLLEPDDYADVAEVRLNGKPAVVFTDGKPIALGRIRALCTLYLSDTSGAIADMVAALYPVLEHQYRSGVSGNTIKTAVAKDEWVAKELGITEALLTNYRELAEAKAIASGEYNTSQDICDDYQDGADVFDLSLG